MIVIKLQGGLGNQLFQYAFGRHLAVRNNVSLKLDLSFYKEQSERSYDLHVFNIHADKVSDFQKLFYCRDSGTIDKFSVKIRDALHHVVWIKEEQILFNKDLLNSGKNVILTGYWQSEKYFKDIKLQLQKELTFKYPPSGLNKDLAEQIENTNAVSVHIRRADYLTDPAAWNMHGTLKREYYEKAIIHILQKVNDPHFYIFSDDHEWAMENIKLKFPAVFINQNKKKQSYEDLRLMSLCRHNIIANSSFSWWGAWLNKNPDKIIIAPLKWFNNFEGDTKDLIPENWIRI